MTFPELLTKMDTAYRAGDRDTLAELNWYAASACNPRQWREVEGLHQIFWQKEQAAKRSARQY